MDTKRIGSIQFNTNVLSGTACIPSARTCRTSGWESHACKLNEVHPIVWNSTSSSSRPQPTTTRKGMRIILVQRFPGQQIIQTHAQWRRFLCLICRDACKSCCWKGAVSSWQSVQTLLPTPWTGTEPPYLDGNSYAVYDIFLQPSVGHNHRSHKNPSSITEQHNFIAL